ncbi:hypothetical protein IPA_00660 [Ignicoccus pacificus DSM 13166]|uniref:Uncharacterized protein n=1 Tax=Ignicoccus pacificus DSM 13166 TaxID=940294 RepID=A0A977KCB1_9CREN|nr:hypothetical protein IPA_00660 [Ignicoccus pacificus DSM 13166]
MRGKVYEMLKSGMRVSDIRKELNIGTSDLRSTIIILKKLGIPLMRKGDRYVVNPISNPPVPVRSYHDVLTASVQATKVLRFLYGEDVNFLWPNKVVKGNEVIASIEGPPLRVRGSLDEAIAEAIVYRTRHALRKRRLSELVRTANILLYKGNVELVLDSGALVTKIKNIDIEGNANTELGKISFEKVKEVRPKVEDR